MVADKDKRRPAPTNPGFKGEYLMNNASVWSIWNEISTSLGLSEWFAEKVEIYGNEIHVFWDMKGDDRKGTIEIRDESQNKIKWVWNDDPESFLSMEILESELSKTVALIVEDHDMNMEHDTLENLWDNHVDRLMARLGLLC